MSFPRPQRTRVFDTIRDQVRASKSFTGLNGCGRGLSSKRGKDPWAVILTRRADKSTYDANQTSIDFLPFTIRVYGSETEIERALEYLKNLWLDKTQPPFVQLNRLGVTNLRYTGTTPAFDAEEDESDSNYGENSMQVVIEGTYTR